MTRKSVVSGLLPAALGPYSHAIVAGGFVFCSGTAGIDPLRVLSVTASRPRPNRRSETLRPSSRRPGRGRTAAGTGAARRPGPQRDHQPEPVELAGQSVDVHGPGSSTEVTSLTDTAASIHAGSLIVPMPAMVIPVSTMSGDSVAAGQPLIMARGPSATWLTDYSRRPSRSESSCAPSGELWTWGPEEAANRVTGPALDFCLLVTQRRHRDDTALTATGAIADQWLSIAESFGGPPGPGQVAGLRTDGHAAQPSGKDG
jgi:hypothetical protein